MEIPVTITDKALKEINKIRDRKKIPEKYGLRIGIRGAGCAGVNYMLGFDTPSTEDGEFDLQGLSVYISKKHTLYLFGLVLDYHEGPEDSGFIFTKPGE